MATLGRSKGSPATSKSSNSRGQGKSRAAGYVPLSPPWRIVKNGYLHAFYLVTATFPHKLPLNTILRPSCPVALVATTSIGMASTDRLAGAAYRSPPTRSNIAVSGWTMMPHRHRRGQLQLRRIWRVRAFDPGCRTSNSRQLTAWHVLNISTTTVSMGCQFCH